MMQSELSLSYKADNWSAKEADSQLTVIHKVWLYGMLLSFFWELPVLQISSMNRVNPRFYDFFFLFGVLLFNRKLFIPIENPVYNAWRNIVIWFTVCAFFYALLLPVNLSLFSLLCAVRYIQGLLVIKMVLISQLDVEKYMLQCAIIGLCIISVYCFFERSTDTYREIEMAGGKILRTYGSYLFGPLSYSYFHLAQIVPLAGVVVISYILWTKKDFIYIVLTVVLCWPVFWCGSRTGMALFAIVLSFSAIRFVRMNKTNYIWLIVSVLIGIFITTRYFPNLFEEATTLNRYQEMENVEYNSVEGRFSIWDAALNVKQYNFWKALPFFGAGFNVAPINGYYRISYGIHCSPIYPLEQAGIL